MISGKRFVLLDRDGTVNVEKHYLSDPDQVELIPHAARGLAEMARLGLGLVVVTNQSAIGRGLFDRARLDQIHERLGELLRAEGVRLDGVYVCPHLPQDECRCRKPRPRLVELAAGDLGFRASDAFMIGDKRCDIELGRAVGATTFLVRTGYGVEAEADESLRPDYLVDDLWRASQVIGSLLDRKRPNRR
ncbi:MAG TPA: HAD family hydrolase [Pirellulales bacterium]|nr:HAD family hydrolase [Pirellulales bacterium]